MITFAATRGIGLEESEDLYRYCSFTEVIWNILKIRVQQSYRIRNDEAHRDEVENECRT